MMRDDLCAEAIAACLPPGKPPAIIVLARTTSTNDEAKARAAAGATHGTVILAEHQTAGRGRLGRTFFSPPAGGAGRGQGPLLAHATGAGRTPESGVLLAHATGLYMSLLLRPENFRLGQPTAITAYAALCVCEAVEAACGINAKIKWVNDVLVNEKKVCGILVEALANSAGVYAYVLGIGVNVCMNPEDFPAEIRDRAGALYTREGTPVAALGVLSADRTAMARLVSRNRLAAEIIRRVLYAPIPTEDVLFAAYRQRLTMLGKAVTVTQGDQVYSAKALDIDSAGRLIVQKENGAQAVLSFGDISVKPER